VKSAAPENYQREPLAVRFFMTIPRGLNNAFGYLSAVPGYRGVIAPMLAFGALAVGIETIYTAMPATDWSLPREERKFIPKIGVEDNPEISRLIPFKGVARSVSLAVLPEPLERFAPTQSKTVWTDPAFWAAIVICAAIQYQESKLFARKPYNAVKAEAESANRTKKIKVNPDALEVAKLKVAKHNSYGTGEETRSGAMILLLYAVEIVGFLYGFKGATSWASSLGWGIYSIFGFEIFHRRKEKDTPAFQPAAQSAAQAQPATATPKDTSAKPAGRNRKKTTAAVGKVL
jgi:hypothetical protein